MTDQPPVPAPQPPAPAPAPGAPTPPSIAPQPEKKEEKAYLWKFAYIIPIMAILWGVYVYFAKKPDPASQVLGSVEVHPFYLPRPFDLRKYEPNFPESKNEPKMDPAAGHFDFAKKQYTITVSNRGSKEAKNVRLIVPQGASFFVNASKPGSPGPVTFIGDSRIELGTLEITENCKIYVWSAEPIAPAEAETVTIAHEGGRNDIKPVTPSKIPGWAVWLIVFAAGGILALYIAAGQEIKAARQFTKATEELRQKAAVESASIQAERKHLIERAEEVMAEIREQHALTIDLQKRTAETYAMAQSDKAELRDLINDNIRQSSELKEMTDQAKVVADAPQDTSERAEKALQDIRALQTKRS